MKKSILATLLASSVVLPSAAFADSLESCVAAIQSSKEGQLVKLEALTTNGKDVYSIELIDGQEQEWEFTCDVATGRIIYEEGEVESAADPKFQKMAKLDEAKAVSIAQAAFPGEVEEVEFELKSDGHPVFEVDIESESGAETKVEVSAVDGKILESSTEKWEIGIEEDERR
ncbi:PepSY domain-containing protein [Neptuniibacter sp. PT8_73]|uniref:PepSY domain-containing protein n=1 Tax=Neptuniibacter sp. PT8_73 TaxID=3398206 RepID=UPI0039F50D68